MHVWQKCSVWKGCNHKLNITKQFSQLTACLFEYVRLPPSRKPYKRDVLQLLGYTKLEKQQRYKFSYFVVLANFRQNRGGVRFELAVLKARP